MIAGIFHGGSGLGDQLFRYITTRTLAEEKGLDWTMLNPQEFKGQSFFLNYNILDLSTKIITNAKSWHERETRYNWVDIRSYDPEINFVEDNTIIDGCFEDSKYWHHNLKNINKWLETKILEVPSSVCVIGFRGGEYASYPELFLERNYWSEAIKLMKERAKDIIFQVHTDDPFLAKQIFPNFEIIDNKQLSHSLHSNMGLNWRAMRYAKYAIIANSSFYIMPRILRHFTDKNALTIAPRGWARHNLKNGTWARPSCYYREFSYI